MRNKGQMTVGDYAIGLLFGAVIVVITAQVFWRYALTNPLLWTEELARILFVWMTFLGAALLLRDAAHIRVTLLIDQLSARCRRRIELLQLALTLAFLVYLVYIGFRWVAANSNARTPALELPMNYAVYASLPVCMLLGIYYAWRRMVRLVRRGSVDIESNEEQSL
jgi:TRAP-type C4-dicarboxylate transport system permease small subunit